MMTPKITREYLQNLKADTENKKFLKKIQDTADEIMNKILEAATTIEAKKCDINVSSQVEELKQDFAEVLRELKKRIDDDISITFKPLWFNQGTYYDVSNDEKNPAYKGYSFTYVLVVVWE
jgi:hypothetical protein